MDREADAVHWTVSVDIAAPLATVLAAVADEQQVMAWSAWPESTGYTCAVEGEPTQIGSEIVFTDRAGREQGRQRLARVTTDRVEYRLENRGPGGRVMRPEVDYQLKRLDAHHTSVHLEFRAEPPLPTPLRQLVGLVMGIRVKALHRKDLAQLKDFVESLPPAA